ncbi:hypothetical protein EHV15_05185 [Paenibacillus oralis]|uniref:Phage minor structural protein GP20 n=1 Tax=Paenibacillus oralis TaxID=2490856 RepID=A0A3P3TWC2_9BACL|nr:phage scaffolding protein [Paenibacillus oralis]RRJ62412.1 hypothetical protein EHV15_05185 [Paenibacillus oralis]
MDLKELLGEELYKQVIEKAGDKHKIAIVSDGSHFPKDKWDEVNAAKKKIEADLKERDKQLEELKKSAGDNEELKAKIKELQDANKEAADKYQKEAKELQLKTALKLKLVGKVHENAMDNVLNEFKFDQIELDETGNIKSGFDDQYKSLQESKGFYFVPENSNETTFVGFKPFNGGGANNDKGDKGGEFGKQLAAQNKQSSDKMQEAQNLYFGGQKA